MHYKEWMSATYNMVLWYSEVINMTLRQEAYSRIDQMTDDGIRVLIDIIDKMKTVSVIGFKDNKVAVSNLPVDTEMSKEQKKRLFMQSAGKVKVDANAINELRERSII